MTSILTRVTPADRSRINHQIRDRLPGAAGNIALRRWLFQIGKPDLEQTPSSNLVIPKIFVGRNWSSLSSDPVNQRLFTACLALSAGGLEWPYGVRAADGRILREPVAGTDWENPADHEITGTAYTDIGSAMESVYGIMKFQRNIEGYPEAKKRVVLKGQKAKVWGRWRRLYVRRRANDTRWIVVCHWVPVQEERRTNGRRGE